MRLRSDAVISESAAPRVDSEVGPLRAVLLHRPGNELKRLTPRNNDQLLFDSIPWVGRAQQEHDAFAEVLRGRGVEVLLLADALRTALADQRAHAAGVHTAVDDRRLGNDLADSLRSHLSSVDAAMLAEVLMAGMTFEELPSADGNSLVRKMNHPHDFAVGRHVTREAVAERPRPTGEVEDSHARPSIHQLHCPRPADRLAT